MNPTHHRASVAILAGGMGTRLAERAGNLPKPMVPVLGKPVLEHQIELCRRHGFLDIALLVQHRHEKISEHFGDGSNFGVRLRYAIEEEPRGTSGALRDALPLLADRFLLLYGDTYLDVDLQRLWAAHTASGASGASATLFLHPNDHPQDSDLVDMSRDGTVRAILPYPHPPGREVRNLVNAALYVLDRDGLEDFTPEKGKADIAKHMFPLMLAGGRRLHGYVTPEYIKDMGTPERLDKVERDIQAGLPEKLSGRQLRRAVFLDRDGTLNREVNHLKSPDQLQLLDGVPAAVRRLNRDGTLAIVVTNQPVVARGDITLDGLEKVHARLESQLGSGGAFIDGLYVCPHHPDKGFKDEVPELKMACRCRKPEPGLIDNACQDLGIGRQGSWMVGDTTSDIEAGRRVGLKTILVRTGHAGGDGKYAVRPDYVCPDLSDAVEWILTGRDTLSRRLAPLAVRALTGTRLVLIGGLARSGKSFAAQVLKETLGAFGRTAHAVSLDGWLKPKDQRHEGQGIEQRFDLGAATDVLREVVDTSGRIALMEPLYDRVNRIAGQHTLKHSIGSADILIVEGVPALLMTDLVSLPGVLKVHMDIEPGLRQQRLAKDYRWRGELAEDHAAALASRELDETPVVSEARIMADFVLSIEGQG